MRTEIEMYYNVAVNNAPATTNCLNKHLTLLTLCIDATKHRYLLTRLFYLSMFSTGLNSPTIWEKLLFDPFTWSLFVWHSSLEFCLDFSFRNCNADGYWEIHVSWYSIEVKPTVRYSYYGRRKASCKLYFYVAGKSGKKESVSRRMLARTENLVPIATQVHAAVNNGVKL